MITPLQALLARTMSGLSQQDVATLLGWAHQSLSKIENGDVNPPASRLKALQDFYEARGVEFLEGEGVRKRPEGSVRSYKGHEGFVEFLTDVYMTCKDLKDVQVVVNNVAEDDFLFWERDFASVHQQRMFELKSKYRIIIKEGDRNFTASAYAEYRWVSPDIYNSNISYYVYGNKAAMIDFGHDDVRIVIVESAAFANFFRVEFEKVWEKAKIPLS